MQARSDFASFHAGRHPEFIRDVVGAGGSGGRQ